MNAEILKKLESRGYWRVEIRPTTYQRERFSGLMELKRAIHASRVELRGWDFPHAIKDDELPISQNSIGGETDWSVHVEIWRAYLSGQFVFRGGVPSDWAEQHHFLPLKKTPGEKKSLPIVSSLWSVSEFLEFAARFVHALPGTDRVHIGLSLHGMKGRMLAGDDPRRAWFEDYGPCREETFTFEREIPRPELLAGASVIAIEVTAKIFELFGYEASDGILPSIQAELLKRNTQGP